MKYVTRKRVKVDRVACPWRITRFIDPEGFRLVGKDDHEILRLEFPVYDALYVCCESRANG